MPCPEEGNCLRADFAPSLARAIHCGDLYGEVGPSRLAWSRGQRVRLVRFQSYVLPVKGGVAEAGFLPADTVGTLRRLDAVVSVSNQATWTEATREADAALQCRAGGIAVSESGAGLFTRVVEAVVVNQTLGAGGRAKVHAPPILQVDSGLQPATLPHIILKSRALALSAVSPLLQAVAGHVQTGGKPGRLVHHRGALGEWRELDRVAQPPCLCLLIRCAGVFLAGGVTTLLPGFRQLCGAPQGLS